MGNKDWLHWSANLILHMRLITFKVFDFQIDNTDGKFLKTEGSYLVESESTMDKWQFCVVARMWRLCALSHSDFVILNEDRQLKTQGLVICSKFLSDTAMWFLPCVCVLLLDKTILPSKSFKARSPHFSLQYTQTYKPHYWGVFKIRWIERSINLDFFCSTTWRR